MEGNSSSRDIYKLIGYSHWEKVNQLLPVPIMNLQSFTLIPDEFCGDPPKLSLYHEPITKSYIKEQSRLGEPVTRECKVCIKQQFS